MGSSALSAPELTARSVGRLYYEHSNMFKFVISSCLAAAALSQYVDPEKAKILKEQRFNAGDGRFGAAYAQEDGTVYREETSADGERVGQYSYIDQAGKTITVRYSAGKDGFKILEGDHFLLELTDRTLLLMLLPLLQEHNSINPSSSTPSKLLPLYRTHRTHLSPHRHRTMHPNPSRTSLPSTQTPL